MKLWATIGSSYVGNEKHRKRKAFTNDRDCRAVNGQTERECFRSLDEISADRKLLLVTNRLSSIRAFVGGWCKNTKPSLRLVVPIILRLSCLPCVAGIVLRNFDARIFRARIDQSTFLSYTHVHPIGLCINKKRISNGMGESSLFGNNQRSVYGSRCADSFPHLPDFSTR